MTIHHLWLLTENIKIRRRQMRHNVTIKCKLSRFAWSAAAVWSFITNSWSISDPFWGFVYILSDRAFWKAFGGTNTFLLWSQTDQSTTAAVSGPRPQQPITTGPRALAFNHDQSGRAMRAEWEREEEGRGLSLWNQYYTIERKNTKSSHSGTFRDPSKQADKQSSGLGNLKYMS